MLSSRVHYSCCHTPPHKGPVGTSASTAYADSSSIPQMSPSVELTAATEDIPPCLPDEKRASQLDHTEDSVQKRYGNDARHEPGLDFGLGMENPQKDSVGWLTGENEELRCPCGRTSCKGKHAEILESRQIAYQHLWASLPEEVYEGIVKHLD